MPGVRWIRSSVQRNRLRTKRIGEKSKPPKLGTKRLAGASTGSVAEKINLENTVTRRTTQLTVGAGCQSDRIGLLLQRRERESAEKGAFARRLTDR